MNISELKELKNFINCYFNQDTDDIYISLEEYIKENRKNINIILKEIKIFLNDPEIGDLTRIKFIEEESDIYYAGYELTPIEWIQFIEKRLEEEINK